MVTKVHRVLAFNQSPWLKTYINFNTHQRSLAGNCSFLKDILKLINISVFEKTEGNLRKRVQVELVTDARLLRKRVANSIFCRDKPITNCLTVVQTTVATLVLNRPIYVGFTVFELSKLHMYDFHYNYMKVKYPCTNQFRLLFTDTDSLAYAGCTDRCHLREYGCWITLSIMFLIVKHFFKDELNSIPMEEFVGLGPKCYAFLCTGKVDRNVLQHAGPVEKKTERVSSEGRSLAFSALFGYVT